jgi:hypothetical protein
LRAELAGKTDYFLTFAPLMLKALNPYYLIVLLVAVASLVFAKINKHSFYHHYFKVIEEVEVRNSQAILASIPTWVEAKITTLASKVQQLISVVIPALLISLFLPIIGFLFLFRPEVWPRLSTRLYRRLHPALAP